MSANFEPSDRLAELALVGSSLYDNSFLYDVVAKVKPSHLFYEDTKIAWGCVLNLFQRSSPIDPVSLRNEIETSGKLGMIGGDRFIFECAQSVPNAAHADKYASIVIDKSIKRSLLDASTLIAEKVRSGEGVGESIVAEAVELIGKVSDGAVPERSVDIRGSIDGIIDSIRDRVGKPWSLGGLSTGFPTLDDIIGGLQNSWLVVIAARPRAGKTSFILNIVDNIAIEQRVGVGIFSLEMNTQSLIEKMIVSRSGIPNKKVRTGDLTSKHVEKLGVAANLIKEAAPICVNDDLDLMTLGLLAESRRMKHRDNVGIIFIDYIQLMRPDKSGNRQEEVAKISRGLKAIARCLDIPVVAAAQLNRQVENREDKRPKLFDFRESGAIEQDSDVAMFIHRPELFEDSYHGAAEIIVAKNRHGETGTVHLDWHPKTTKFIEIGCRNSVF